MFKAKTHRSTPVVDRCNACERGYDRKWRRARAAYLAAHPLCAECGKHGRLEPATVIDHVVPHKGDSSRFWDQSNWQPMCKRCHDRKTATEDGGLGNVRNGSQ